LSADGLHPSDISYRPHQDRPISIRGALVPVFQLAALLGGTLAMIRMVLLFLGKLVARGFVIGIFLRLPSWPPQFDLGFQAVLTLTSIQHGGLALWRRVVFTRQR